MDNKDISSCLVGGQNADNLVETADSKMEKYSCLVGGRTAINSVEIAGCRLQTADWRNIAVRMEVKRFGQGTYSA